MFCIFCQQQSKVHVLSASPDLHGSFYLCLMPQARTSDLTYDVGVEVDYFEYILLRGFFISWDWEKAVCSQCRLERSTLPISPGLNRNIEKLSSHLAEHLSKTLF